MPFVRLNQLYNYDNRKFDIRSNIYMAYGEEVEELTAPSLTDMRMANYMDCYVEMEQHKQLATYLAPKGIDSLVYLTGVTGSGKTTLLKAVFEHNPNDIVFLNDSIIITFVWKPTEKEKLNSSYSVTAHYANFLLACVKRICKRFSIEQYKRDTKEYLDFIEHNDLDFFAQGRGEGMAKIENLRDFDPLKFALCALRYVLTKSPIRNVIFLFDELEEAGKDFEGKDLELKVIELAYTIKHILGDRSSAAKKTELFRTSVVISCRHYVYRIVTSKKKQSPNKFWTKVNAESQSETMIDLSTPPRLIELLKKRKEVIIETITSVADREEFEEIFSIVNEIVSQCGEIILALSIGNIRDAFKYIQYLLFNKRWLQRKENYMGAFSISASREDYNLSLPSFLRALALRENTVYTHESIIPNLLDNTSGKKDLSVLIVLSFFINKQNDPELRKDFNSQFDIENEFKTIVDTLFEDDKEHIYKAFNFLLEERLLLRSSHCCQEDSADEPHVDSELGTWKYVYISQQTNILWKLIEQNSVLFELFVDDIKLKTCIQNTEDLKRRCYLQFNVLAFKECINYLMSLIDLEDDMLIDLSSRSSLNDYILNFGDKSICWHLYAGLKKSFDIYYRDYNNDASRDELEELLDNVVDKFKKTKLLKSKIIRCS